MPYNLSAEVVERLLDKLGSDDVFRDQFQADPAEALASLGHRAAPGDAASLMCLKVSRLADKADIQAARNTLRTELLSSQAAQMPITLEMRRKG